MNLNRLQLVVVLAKFSSFFGLVPWLNYHRHAVYVKLFKCYSITLTILFTLLSVYLYILRLKMFNTDVISDTLDVLEEVGGIGLFAVSSLGSAFWNRSKWEEFFNLIHHVESEFKKYIVQKKRDTLPRSTIILLIFSITDFCLLLTNDIISTGFPPLYVSLDMFVFTFILMINITYTTVIYIQNKFEEINCFLLGFESVNSNLSRTIERIRALYVTWHQIVEIFNDLFGWPLMFIHLYYFGLLENYLVYLTDIFLKKSEPQVFAIIANSLSISIWTISLGVLMFSCSSVAVERDQLEANCYHLQQVLVQNTKVKEELDDLIYLVNKLPLRFTAARYFEIKKSTLLSVVSTVTTYFIVVMQLKKLNTLK